eukprot:gene42076-52158_t
MTKSNSPFPLSGLLALAMAGFITILTEALPAGLLPQMGASLDASNAMVGQLVTSYALGFGVDQALSGGQPLDA